MALYHFHRVLITASILFDIVFTIYCVRKHNLDPQMYQGYLFMAVASSVVTLGLITYLIYFHKRMTVLRHVLESPR